MRSRLELRWAPRSCHPVGTQHGLNRSLQTSLAPAPSAAHYWALGEPGTICAHAFLAGVAANNLYSRFGCRAAGGRIQAQRTGSSAAVNWGPPPYRADKRAVTGARQIQRSITALNTRRSAHCLTPPAHSPTPCVRQGVVPRKHCRKQPCFSVMETTRDSPTFIVIYL